MEINKVIANAINKETSKIGENQKIVCDEGGCYLVNIDESQDVEAELVLDEKQDTSETKKPDETKNSSKTKKADKTKNKAITKLNKNNLKKEVRNKKGTTYIIVGGDSCGICKNFEPKLKNIANKLGDKANFVSLTLPSKGGSDYYNTFYKLANETGNFNSKNSYGYPIIIKCVDGKATELYSRSDIPYSDENKMKNWFKSKIEGTIEKETSTKTTETENEDCKDGNCELPAEVTENDCKDGSCEIPAEVTENNCKDGSCELPAEDTADEVKDDNKSKTTKYIENLLGLNKNSDSDDMTEYWTKIDFTSCVKAANSISALKKLLFEIPDLNENIQIKIMDAINDIKYGDDLNEAKSKVLAALK